MNVNLIYSSSLVGVLVGLLGGITGTIASLRSRKNAGSARLLRLVLRVDVATGGLLVMAGLLWRLFALSDLAKSTADAALYGGSVLLGIIGLGVRSARFRGLAPAGILHALGLTGFLFIAPAAHSSLNAASPWPGMREMIWGASMLSIYCIFLVAGKRIDWRSLARG